jgi:PEGA domain
MLFQLYRLMRLKTSLITLTLGIVALTFSGCAFFTTGRSQSVVIRSNPEGAVVRVNGIEIGHAPLRVALPREDLFRVDIEKAGYASQAALIMPNSENYQKRLFRWGVDYDLGATKILVPEELVVELKPAMGDFSGEDKYQQMVGQITRADAMLASGELDAVAYRNLVKQIIAFYR